MPPKIRGELPLWTYFSRDESKKRARKRKKSDATDANQQPARKKVVIDLTVDTDEPQTPVHRIKDSAASLPTPTSLIPLRRNLPEASPLANKQRELAKDPETTPPPDSDTAPSFSQTTVVPSSQTQELFIPDEEAVSSPCHSDLEDSEIPTSQSQELELEMSQVLSSQSQSECEYDISRPPSLAKPQRTASFNTLMQGLDIESDSLLDSQTRAFTQDTSATESDPDYDITFPPITPRPRFTQETPPLTQHMFATESNPDYDNDCVPPVPASPRFTQTIVPETQYTATEPDPDYDTSFPPPTARLRFTQPESQPDASSVAERGLIPDFVDDFCLLVDGDGSFPSDFPHDLRIL